MSLTELFFPRRCFSCGALGTYLCPGCIKKLRLAQPQGCLYCKKPSLHGLTHPPCKRKNGIDGAAALFLYDNTLKKFIKGLKYSLTTAAFGDLFFLVGTYGKEELLFYQTKKHIHLQPVPLFWQKQKTRGFNQAEVISNMITRLISLPRTQILERRINTPAQAQIVSGNKRRENVRGVFGIKKGGKTPEEVLLIDDVVTTGATVCEAARTLKRNGAKKVYVFSVAKG